MKLQGTGLIIIMAFTLVAGIGVFFAVYFLNAFHTAAPSLFPANSVGASAYSNGSQSVNYLDTFIVFLFMASVFIEALSGSQVKTNPAFAFIGFFVLVITIILAVVFHNVFFSFTQATAFGGIQSQTDTVILFEGLPLIGAVAWAIIMIFTFSSGGSGSFGSSGNYG